MMEAAAARQRLATPAKEATAARKQGTQSTPPTWLHAGNARRSVLHYQRGPVNIPHPEHPLAGAVHSKKFAHQKAAHEEQEKQQQQTTLVAAPTASAMCMDSTTNPSYPSTGLRLIMATTSSSDVVGHGPAQVR
jgi:hypothetical protein